jgi:hypothetical protein
MVKREEPQAAPSSASVRDVAESTIFRKVSSVAMIILLYTAATPFSPFAWLSYELEGSFLLDRLLAGVFLFAAIYFQWRIGAQTTPVAVCLPTGSRQSIRNGRIETTNGGGELVFIYKPVDYWKYIGIEAVMLGVAEFADREIWRRGLVSAVIAALWSVGWFVTPQRVKMDAWEYLKVMWFWIALDEIMRVGMGGRGGVRRRRW